MASKNKLTQPMPPPPQDPLGAYKALRQAKTVGAAQKKTWQNRMQGLWDAITNPKPISQQTPVLDPQTAAKYPEIAEAWQRVRSANPEAWRGIKQVTVGEPGMLIRARNQIAGAPAAADYGGLGRRISVYPEGMAVDPNLNPEDLLVHELTHEEQRQQAGMPKYIYDMLVAPKDYMSRWYEQEALKREHEYGLARQRREGKIQ